MFKPESYVDKKAANAVAIQKSGNDLLVTWHDFDVESGKPRNPVTEVVLISELETLRDNLRKQMQVVEQLIVDLRVIQSS